MHSRKSTTATNRKSSWSGHRLPGRLAGTVCLQNSNGSNAINAGIHIKAGLTHTKPWGVSW